MAERFARFDSRPLSVFRIGIALILLKEALLHLPLAALFYSDSGVVPRSALIGQVRFSLMDALSMPWMAAALFIVWAVVAVLLLLGIHARLMTVLNFILIVSISSRNPFIENAADNLLRLLSFWMIFIPLDRDFTLATFRRRLNKRVNPPSTLSALPIWLIQGQVALVYLMAGLFKVLGQPWRSGAALFQVLQIGTLLRPFGFWLADQLPYSILQLLTYAIMVTEMAFPILVFVPFGQPRLRRMGLLTVLLLHLGIGLAMTTEFVDFLLVFATSLLIFLARPGTLEAPRRRITALLLLFLLILWQNADDLRRSGIASLPPIPIPLSSLISLIGLEQHWQLFAPLPLQVDWTIIPIGTFSDGTHLDLETGKPPQIEIKPAQNSLTDYRWVSLKLSLIQNRSDAWSRYLCHEHLDTIQLRALTRHWHAVGEAMQPIQNNLLWLHRCSD